ncbi:MAG: hypothetical protein WCX69_01060 [Candidatus Paceibacterota bacterium]
MKQKSPEILPVPKKKRSCAYPMLSLPQAIVAAKSLCDNFGEGPYLRASAAKGMGYSSFSGAASSKIGSLVHFGLLVRAGGMYSIAPLAKKCFSYPEEGSREAIVDSAQKPVLYRSLFNRFSNKALPEKLEVILAADYGITQKAAAGAAANFIATLEFSGLLKDGRLLLPEAEIAIGENLRINGSLAEKKERSGICEMIAVKLSSGIEISFPEYMSYRLSMGEFAGEIKSLDGKAMGGD